MSSSPIFASSPQKWHARVAAANTARDGSGTIVDLVPTQTDIKSRIERVTFKAEAAIAAATLVRLWLHNGSAWRLLDEFEVPIVAASGSVPSWRHEHVFPGGFTLLDTQKLGITCHTADPINAFVEAGNYSADE